MELISDESTLVLNSCDGMRGINSRAIPGTSLTKELERTTDGGVGDRSLLSSLVLALEEELLLLLLLEEELDDFFVDLLPLADFLSSSAALLCLEERWLAAE